MMDGQKQELIKRYLLITQYIQHRLNSYKRLIEKRNENGLLTIYAPTFFSELDKWLSELKNDKDEISNYENDDNNTIKVLHNLIEEGMKLFLDCKQKISNEQIKNIYEDHGESFFANNNYLMHAYHDASILYNEILMAESINRPIESEEDNKKKIVWDNHDFTDDNEFNFFFNLNDFLDKLDTRYVRNNELPEDMYDIEDRVKYLEDKFFEFDPDFSSGQYRDYEIVTRDELSKVEKEIDDLKLEIKELKDIISKMQTVPKNKD